jgi:hypothetical protein
MTTTEVIDYKNQQNIQSILDSHIRIEEWIVNDSLCETTTDTDTKMSYPNSFNAKELDEKHIRYFNAKQLSDSVSSIDSETCSVGKIIKNCIDYRINNPLFIMECREPLDVQYELCMALNRIDCDLYLFKDDLYFENELTELFNSETSLSFKIDFKSKCKRRNVMHITIYIIDQDIELLYDELEKKENIRNAILKHVSENEQSEACKYFGV